MATTGTMLMDFVTQNAVVFLVTVLLATIVAFSAYHVARKYLPSNTYSVRATSEIEDSTNRSPEKQECDAKHGKESGDNEGHPAMDPVYYCEHIQGEIKKVKQGVATRKICENLSAEQIAEERQRQQDQLAEIFKLMQQQEDKFGISSMEEMQEQMRLYADMK